MKSKILEQLTAVNGQYNLPKDVLEQIADIAPKDIKEENIASWVESMKPSLAIMQSYADKRVTSFQKDVETLKRQLEEGKKNPEGDLEKRLGEKAAELSKTLDEKLAGYEKKLADMLSMQRQFEEGKKNEDFNKIVERVAEEIGFTDKELLELAKATLTPDMDEKKINENLSSKKKLFIDKQLMEVEGGLATNEEAMRKRADDWVKQQIDSQK